MRHRDCPACGYTVPKTGLRIVLSAPTRLGASWPRYFCPRCQVQLRSSNRSLVPSFLFFIVGVTALLATGSLSAPFADAAQVIGFVALFLSLACVYWFHKWEVVSDRT